MKATVNDLVQKAEEFNAKYFDGALVINNLTFRISNRMTRTRGFYNGHKRMITISGIIASSEIEWHKTLLHELIHAYQHVAYRSVNHGPTFKKETDRIYKLSNGQFDINRTTFAADTAVAEELHKRKVKRIGEQYLISRNNRNWFLRNLTPLQIRMLKKDGYSVYRMDKVETTVRNIRSFRDFTNNGVRYYYPDTILNEIPSYKEV